MVCALIKLKILLWDVRLIIDSEKMIKNRRYFDFGGESKSTDPLLSIKLS